jgi:hypothetical protein
MRPTDTNLGPDGHPAAPNGAWGMANCLFMTPSILFGAVSSIVLNTLVDVLDRPPDHLQSLFAVPSLVVGRWLQFFRSRQQIAESFLHVRLIFAEREL